MTADPRKARVAAVAEHEERRARLYAEFGQPERLDAADALAQARAAMVPVDPAVTADEVWASIYRDDAAADGWLESNLAHNGHPALAKVPLPDGRVIGIMDLRPALDRARLARAQAEGELT